MNSPHEPDVAPVPQWMKVSLALFGGYLLLTIIAYAVVGSVGLHAVHAVLFGWLAFLSERLGTFQADGPTATVGLGALVLLLFIVQMIGARITSRASEPRRWTWRSTVAATIGMIVLFAGGVSLIGAVHQAIWLTSGAQSRSTDSPKPSWPQAGPLNVIAQARHAAMQTQSRNNLKQIGLAIHNYHDSFGSFPSGANVDDDGHARHGWVIYLNAYANFWVPTDWKQEPWDGPTNRTYAKGALLDFVNPQLGWHGQFDEHGYAYMHYAANVHGFPNNRGLKIADIIDGTSNTLAIGEVAENFQPWASPWNRRDAADGINDVPWGFGGPPSQNGALFLFFDGSVKMIGRNVDRNLLRSLGLPHDDGPLGNWEAKLQ